MNGYHEEEQLGRIYDHRLARRLIRYLRPYRWVIMLSVALLILVSVLRLAGPLLTEIAIDDHIQKGDSSGLGGIALLFLVLLASQFAVSFVQTYLTNWAASC